MTIETFHAGPNLGRLSDVTIIHGDCIEAMRELADDSIDAIVTDPPYGLEFMGKEWDKFGKDTGNGYAETPRFIDRGGATPLDRVGGPNHFRAGAPFQRWCELWTAEALRVLKPGGHLLAFGGTRAWHRLAVAVEDAGFEIRDSIAWLYGSGFSKGGLLKNKPGIAWCSCGENAIPYNHADHSDLSRVREDVQPPAVARSTGEGGVLLAPVQRSGEGSGLGDARSQGPSGMVAGSGSIRSREDDRGAESGMAGRLVHRTGEGVSDDPQAGAPEGSRERVRSGASSSHGADDRTARDAARGSSPHQQGSSGQPTGEPEALSRSHESLDDGAFHGRTDCARCGGLNPAFKGYSVTLKPAFEPVVVGRKPFKGNVAANVLTHGTGALNIDACRIKGSAPSKPLPAGVGGVYDASDTGRSGAMSAPHTAGRWPANVVLDESQAAALDEQSGTSVSRIGKPRGAASGEGWGMTATGAEYADTGGASRFFFVTDREGDTLESCDPANTAELSSSQPSASGGSAPDVAATLDSREGNSTGHSRGPSTSATVSESTQSAGSSTPTTPSTALRSLPESQPSRLTQNGSHVRSAETSKPTATTTTTASLSKSAGSVAPATSDTTSMSREVGEAGLPLNDLETRFRYCAKAPKKERPVTDDGTAHPTVKPLALMRWLVRLVTPPGGKVLDPFAGSGTTVEAALLEGFRVIGIEREADYLPMIQQRIARCLNS